jgi:hypothetical protein
MTDKMVKNEQWYIKFLASKVSNGEIDKPKFQRKRKWKKLPQKDNYPSDKRYIEFLYATRNSVHAITFGRYGDKLSNIDGNNRINAIINYLEEPFSIFEEKMFELKEFVREKISIDVAIEVENIIKIMRYDELMEFKYNSYFIKKGYVDLYNTHLKIIRDELEPFFETMIDNFKIDGICRFDNDVLINVNIFFGYSEEELSEVFGKINKYNSCLTEQENMASELFKVIDFRIEDEYELIKYEIQQQLEQYYDENSCDEKLSCYVYNKMDDQLNAYDFMVGIQNYSNNKCVMVEKTNSDGTSLFFKIFKTLYKKTTSWTDTFTSKNVNDFIKHIQNVLIILEKISSCIFMKKLVDGNNNLFAAVNKKLSSLSKNNMFLIIIAIIGYTKNDIHEGIILKSIEKCILYHFMVHSLANKEKREEYKLKDGILHEAGGAFIDNKAKEFLASPSNISDNITENVMRSLITDLVDENIKNRDYELRSNGKPKYDKRRSRKMHEKILLYYYYVNNIPTRFLNNEFWIEHIFPFSSSWNNQVDIDRLGNIMPIIDTLNKERGVKHIREYKKLDKQGFLDYIKIIPTETLYDQLVLYENRKPHIKDGEKYNSYCSENEGKLIECFLKNMF